MIKINLLPVRASKKKETARQQLVIAAGSVGVVLLALAALFVYQRNQISTAKAEIENSDKELQRLKTIIGEIDNIKKLQEDVKKKLEILDRLRKEKAGPATRFARLSEATPDKLWLTRYSENGANLALSGVAFNEDLIADFLRNLQSSNEFGNVELVVSEQVEMNQVKAKRFDVNCVLKSVKKEEPPSQKK